MSLMTMKKVTSETMRESRARAYRPSVLNPESGAQRFALRSGEWVSEPGALERPVATGPVRLASNRS